MYLGPSPTGSTFGWNSSTINAGGTNPAFFTPSGGSCTVSADFTGRTNYVVFAIDLGSLPPLNYYVHVDVCHSGSQDTVLAVGIGCVRATQCGDPRTFGQVGG